jgi:hypothetical protein
MGDADLPRHLDPQGKQALFDPRVRAAPDQLTAGNRKEGKQALYSTGPRQNGTVVVECSQCQVRIRSNLLDLGLRLLPFTAWLPGLRHSHFMRCPSCGRYTWCRIGWTE